MKSVDAEGFFEKILAQAVLAEHAAGEVPERWFDIGTLVLQLRFLGSALEPYVVPALAHLEIAESRRRAADLTLHCWDCASLGVEFPQAPVDMQAFTPRGEIDGLNDHRFHAAFGTQGRQLSVFDAHLRRGAYCVGQPAGIPRFEIAEPIRALLSWFMRENGRQLLHAAAVGEANGGVLLIGRSGAGKSNTALGCLASNLRYASDDFCAVSVAGDPQVYSIYCTGKTHESDWCRHPFLAELAPALDPERREKAIYFLSSNVSPETHSRVPAESHFAPAKSRKNCEARPISPAAVLRLAAPDTAKLLPGAGSDVMRGLAKLVRTVPCYELLLGSVPGDIPGVISALLSG